jgi:hypothetical protein
VARVRRIHETTLYPVENIRDVPSHIPNSGDNADNALTKSYITSAVQSVEPDVSPRLADHPSHQPRKSQQKVTIVSHHASAHATAYRNVKSKHVLYHHPKSHRSGLCSIVSVPTNHSQRPIRTTCIPRLSEERFVGMVCSVTFVLSEKYDSDDGPLDWGVVSRAAVVAVCPWYMYTVSTPFFSLLILFRTRRHQNSVLQHPRRPKAYLCHTPRAGSIRAKSRPQL